MLGKYPVVTICGSTKFKEEILKIQEMLTLEGRGKIVFTSPIFSHHDNVQLDDEQIKMLSDMHLRKIDISDEVVVVTVDNYIGESVRTEITYAEQHRKLIRYFNIKREKD